MNSDNINWDQVMSLDGTTTADGATIQLMPRAVIELQIEVLSNHPELAAELGVLMKEENGDPNVWYGAIAAYCGIVLDGSYNQEYLCEQLSRSLINKREGIVVAPNSRVVPIHKDLLQ
jgi:hypothetical protein